MNLLYWLLSPNRVLRFSQFWLNFCIAIFVLLIFVNLYMYSAFDLLDYKQGPYAQIMFIHVPAAWLSLMLYIMLSFTSLMFIVIRHPLLSQLSNALCLCSLACVIITLVTGSLWGKPTWGTWWVWDARLTSVLILFIILVGIYALKKSFSDSLQGSIAASILTLLGLINIPIIKFSVDWWNTLHQPSSITIFGSHIHYSILLLLLSSFLDLFFFFSIIVLIHLRAVVLESKLSRSPIFKHEK